MAADNKTFVLGFQHLSAEVGLVYTIARLTQGTIAFIGNGLTLIVIGRYSFLRTRSALLVASLAVADLSSCWGIILATIYYYTDFASNEPVRKVICIMKESINLIYMAGNVITILWIAVDRYIYCWHPTKYTKVTTIQRYQILLLATWAYIVAMVTGAFTLVNTYRPGVLCVFTNPELMPPIIFIVVVLAQFILYSTITVVLYVLIGHLACKKVRVSNMTTQRVLDTSRRDNVETDNDKREHRITKTLAVILGLYFTFYLPGIIAGFYVNENSSMPLVIFYLFSVTWFHLNSCVNPFVYARGNMDMKRGLKKLANGCKYCKRKNTIEST